MGGKEDGGIIIFVNLFIFMMMLLLMYFFMVLYFILNIFFVVKLYSGGFIYDVVEGYGLGMVFLIVFFFVLYSFIWCMMKCYVFNMEIYEKKLFEIMFLKF